MATAGPRPSSRRDRARSARRSARRSNSAGWRKAAPTSIPALRPTSRMGYRRGPRAWSRRPAARSRTRKARRLRFGEATRRLSSCRNSSPGAIRAAARAAAMTRCCLLRQAAARAPASAASPHRRKRVGIGGEGVAVCLAAEQIKPLSGDHPEPRVAGDGDAAGQIDRVIAAELRSIDLGMGDKGRPDCPHCENARPRRPAKPRNPAGRCTGRASTK